MPNLLAYLMLALWPIVTVMLFRRLPHAEALLWTLVGGYLILPPQPAVYDFPLMPPLHKENIPAFAAVLTALGLGALRQGFLPQSRFALVLIAVFVLSPILTVLTNPEFVTFGVVFLPGLGLKDAVALTISQFLFLAPFLLSYRFLNTAEAQHRLILALMLGGLALSLPALIEIRLSPQLNVWIYGFFPSDFSQTFRFGGWRPTVFLYHGLWLAFFMLMALISALALARFDRASRARWFLIFLYLGGVLVLCKSLGSLVFAVFLVPLVLLLGVRLQMAIAVVLALLAVGYPILKGTELLPDQELLAQAERIHEDRAASLRFRFENEDVLLDRLNEKPVFGWGSWGRNQLWDPISGELDTVTDGRWIITLGTFGWVGFLAEFFLITLPIFMLWREMRLSGPTPVSPYIGPLCLLLGINAVDMIPNATITPITWVLSGALMGYAETLRRTRLGIVMAERAKMTWSPLMT